MAIILSSSSVHHVLGTARLVAEAANALPAESRTFKTFDISKDLLLAMFSWENVIINMEKTTFHTCGIFLEVFSHREALVYVFVIAFAFTKKVSVDSLALDWEVKTFDIQVGNNTANI